MKNQPTKIDRGALAARISIHTTANRIINFLRYVERNNFNSESMLFIISHEHHSKLWLSAFIGHWLDVKLAGV